MEISARNMLKGTVSSIQEGAVNGVVTIDLHDTKVKADITMEAIRDLGLKVGEPAFAIIKASSVMFASESVKGISARNQLVGTVSEVKEGAVTCDARSAFPFEPRDAQRVVLRKGRGG